LVSLQIANKELTAISRCVLPALYVFQSFGDTRLYIIFFVFELSGLYCQPCAAPLCWTHGICLLKILQWTWTLKFLPI